MATVAELSAPYENHLRPVLPAGYGVCRTCHTSVVGNWPDCYPCNQSHGLLTEEANAVDFIALAVKGEQLARELRVYKAARASVDHGSRYGLAAVLWRWLSIHEACVATTAGVDQFPIVTTVPSTQGRLNHPLNDLVHGIVGTTRDRAQNLLTANPAIKPGREAHNERFIASRALDGEPVLVIDDTWTTGAMRKARQPL